ncbi:unnamed protein product, partial [Effrenium voratum]
KVFEVQRLSLTMSHSQRMGTYRQAWKLLAVFLCLRSVTFLAPTNRRAVLAAATSALGVESRLAPATAFGSDPADWFGYYRDPNHPGCTRKIQYDDTGPMVIFGTDGNPGCLGDGSKITKNWRIYPTFTPGSDSMVFDFSSKVPPSFTCSQCRRRVYHLTRDQMTYDKLVKQSLE